jgi:hypothetical protein
VAHALLAAISARTGIAVARLAAGNAGELVAGFSGRPGGLGTSGPQVPGWRHGADLGGHCGVSTMPRREWHCLFAEELVLPMAELLSEARHHHDLRVWVLRYAAPYATIVVRAAVVAQRLPNMRMVNGWRRDGTSARSSASFAKATPGRQALRLDGAAAVGTNALATLRVRYQRHGGGDLGTWETRLSPLFALIAKDVGVDALMPEEPPRKIGHGRARHDAMLVIAWLLERWPQRLMIAADMFGVTKRRWRVCSRPSQSGMPYRPCLGSSHATCSGVPKAGRILRMTHVAIRTFSMRPVECCWPATHAWSSRPHG